MNISQLEYLVAAVDQGSFSDAAKALYVSQQAISKAISGLEKELQVELFAKSGRNNIPTPQAVLLAPRAKEIIYGCQDIRDFAKSLLAEDEEKSNIRGSINIAVASSPYEGSYLHSDIFNPFKQAFPSVDITPLYRPSATCLAAVQEGVMDAAIILGRYTDEDFNCSKMFDSLMYLAMSEKHPLAKREEATIAQARHYPIASHYDLRYCYAMLRKHFQEREYQPRLVDVAPTMEAYRRFFYKQNGLQFVLYGPLHEALMPGVKSIPLVQADQIKVPICLVYPIEGKNAKVCSLLKETLVKSKFNSIHVDSTK